jgi:signal transduction histidine kinase/ActR/RegA family two-component response regulator
MAAVRSSRPHSTDYRILMRDGVYRQISVRGVPVFDESGAVREWVGTFHDITDRQQLEDQLRQAQRMEALGRLAGGVAHDFNNLLTVINGFADLLLSRLGDEEPTRGDLELIHRAGQRASLLTQQLLAFSRKQVMRPEPLSLNDTIGEVEPMLSRLLGDDVSVHVELDPAAGTVLADPGQIQQVLMNLAVNARDAMPSGGTLTLRTRNVDLHADAAICHRGLAPGRCVSVSVTDTGLGMTPAVRARLFEPFFTTKEAGKGTGLGLSTVYGIVHQSGGHVWVESEPGAGSTFTLFFPRVDAPSVAHKAKAEAPVAGGHEHILVVEDADAVGRLANEVLRSYGYRVSTVVCAPDALELIAAGNRPDLLLTDVVLPGMSGPVLASRLSASVPGLAVLFMSGYSDDMLGHHGIVDPAVRFLQKPFSPLGLARAVREALDNRPSISGGESE